MDIEKIINETSDILLRIAYSHTYNREEAKDIVQNVYIKLWQKKPNLADKQLIQWLIRVTINECNDFFRQLKRRNEQSLVEETAISEKKEESLLYYLQQLSPSYRDVIILHYYQGYKVKEIAQILKTSENAISLRLHKAKSQLKRLIQEEL